MNKNVTPRLPRFDKEWNEMLDMLAPDRREVLYRCIRGYQLTGDEPRESLEGAEMMVFLLIKKIVDRRAKMRTARRLKREHASRCADTAIGKSEEKVVVESGQSKSKALDSLMDFDKIVRDEKGRYVIRTSEDMKRCIMYERQIPYDPKRKVVYKYVGD